MTYDLRYHPKVAEEDLPKISAEVRRRVLRAIETKLTTAPELYGVPLRGSLRGYSKLRVGDHRVVFSLGSQTGSVVAIVHRRAPRARRSQAALM